MLLMYIFLAARRKEAKACFPSSPSDPYCSGGATLASGLAASRVPNLPAKILDFRGFDSNITFNFKGLNSHVRRDLSGKLESTNLSLEVLSRERA